MDKGKKALIVVLVDFALVALIVFSVYMMLKTDADTFLHNLFMILIVISIPTMFFVTYLSFSGDKYQYDADEMDRMFGVAETEDKKDDINNTQEECISNEEG